MISTMTRRLAAAGLSILAVATVGCGGGDDDNGGTTAGTQFGGIPFEIDLQK